MKAQGSFKSCWALGKPTNTQRCLPHSQEAGVEYFFHACHQTFIEINLTQLAKLNQLVDEICCALLFVFKIFGKNILYKNLKWEVDVVISVRRMTTLACIEREKYQKTTKT